MVLFSSSSPSLVFISLALLHIAIRVQIANQSPIMDCDEVYNYWEPLHYLVYGSGMQTWEYASEYGLRTYAYLMIPMIPLTYMLQYWIRLLRPAAAQTILRIVTRGQGYGYSLWTTQLQELLLLLQQQSHGVLHKVLLFRFLRCSLALLTSLVEIFFCYQLYNFYTKTIIRHSSFPNIALWTWILLLSSSGMFHASSAFLPSSTVMNYLLLSMSYQISFLQSFCQLEDHKNRNQQNEERMDPTTFYTLQTKCRKHIRYAILWGLVAVLGTGWPFCAILFIPLGFISIAVVYRLGSMSNSFSSSSTSSSLSSLVSVIHLLLVTCFDALLIQVIVSCIDYKYYGRWISPSWNIFMYNAAGGGDELYGVEPISFYIKNLLLNWNGVALGGLFCLPLWYFFVGIQKWTGFHPIVSSFSSSSSYSVAGIQGLDPFTLVLTVILLPMYIWIAVVFSRPHKEERFLFPIFPLLAVGCAFFIQLILSFWNFMFPGMKNDEKNHRQWLKGCFFIFPIILLSISRSMALSFNYIAPLQVYSDLYNHILSKQLDMSLDKGQNPMLICTCGEWYRFPSSFHLPDNTHLAFLKSSFDGQLPQPFTKYGSRMDSTSLLRGKFNDMNKEEMDRYVSIDDCSYIVELGSLDDKGDERHECIEYMKSSGNEGRHWRKIGSRPFLDTRQTSFLHRILYVPYERKVIQQEYSFYEALL